MSDRGRAEQRWAEHRVTEQEGGRTVREILTGTLGVSGRMIQRLTRSQGIRLNRGATHLKQRVRPGDVVAARVSHEEEGGLEPEPMELRVVHEDEEVLVLDKPPFLLTHPVAAGQRGTLAHGVAHHFAAQGLRARVRPVHRLDRDTSGLLLFAKSAFAHQFLDRELRDRTLRRGYLALVQGVIAEDQGVVDAPIGPHPSQRHLRAVARAGGEPALTRFRVLRRFADATLAEVELETGRTHQIRVHMSHLGHPLLGDRQYGGPEISGLRRQALHADRISFVHPSTRERLSFEAPLPEDLEGLRERLGNEAGESGVGRAGPTGDDR